MNRMAEKRKEKTTLAVRVFEKYEEAFHRECYERAYANNRTPGRIRGEVMMELLEPLVKKHITPEKEVA